jgi:hypothetical protein
VGLIALGLVVLMVWWSVDRFGDGGGSGPVSTDNGSRSTSAESEDDGSGHDGSGHAGTDKTGNDKTGSDESGTGPAAPNAEAVVQTCAEELADTVHVIRAARPGVDSWRAHTQARTDMLAGRISERRMESIYERTKRRGHAAQHHFHASMSGLEQRVPCRGLRDLPARSRDGRSHDCLVRARAATAALRAARSTMHEWRLHLHHMADYADGGMSTGKAMTLWVKAWRKAPEGISAYADTRSHLARAPLCRTDG